MSIFKKVIKEEEEEFERPISKGKLLEKEQKTQLLKRKKKEPPKPWTKKERYLVLLVLGITVIISSLLGLSAREWKLPGFPRLKLPSFSLFKSETIVIEGDKDKAGGK